MHTNKKGKEGKTMEQRNDAIKRLKPQNVANKQRQ